MFKIEWNVAENEKLSGEKNIGCVEKSQKKKIKAVWKNSEEENQMW